MFMVAAMASCAKNEVREINPQNPNRIGFSTYVGTSTKAGITTTNNIADAGVYALSYLDNAFAAPFMNNVEIKATNGWATETPYLWPITGSVDFFAYSPYSAAAAIDADGVLTDDSFAIAATADTQVDLLVADALDDKTKDDGVVAINFGHMLSKVDFQIVVKSSKDYDIEINAKDFAVVGIDGEHEGMDIDDARAMVNADFATTSVYTYAAASPTIGTGVIAKTDTEAKTFAINGTSADAFMLLPQSLTTWTPAPNSGGVAEADLTGAAFRMYYNLQLNGEDVVATTGEYQAAYFPLPTQIKWEAGKSYLYTLTFDASDLGSGGFEPDPKDPDDPKTPDPVIEGDKITFSVTVSEWDDETDIVLPNPGANLGL